MSKKVLCLGIIVGDFLVKPVEEMPQKGKLTLVDRAELHIGGCAANTGIVLKKLGVDVGVTGKVGNDNLGKFIINKLKEEGIDISGVKISDVTNTSGTAVLVNTAGERSFLHSTGTNAHLKLEDFDIAYIKSFDILHVAGAFIMPGFDGKPMAQLLKKARENNITTCLDTCWDASGKWMELLEESLPLVDYFLPSFEEAKMITGKETPEEISELLISKGVGNVCLKMGEKGSFIANGKEKHYFPPLKIKVVDTTGAGDGYVAGFLTGLVKGNDFKSSGRLANVTGAKIATSMGATSGVSSWEDLESFAERHGNEI
jgi:sugar/nucleoside kinase (ribokinase family)